MEKQNRFRWYHALMIVAGGVGAYFAQGIAYGGSATTTAIIIAVAAIGVAVVYILKERSPGSI